MKHDKRQKRRAKPARVDGTRTPAAKQRAVQLRQTRELRRQNFAA